MAKTLIMSSLFLIGVILSACSSTPEVDTAPPIIHLNTTDVPLELVKVAWQEDTKENTNKKDFLNIANEMPINSLPGGATEGLNLSPSNKELRATSSEIEKFVVRFYKDGKLYTTKSGHIDSPNIGFKRVFHYPKAKGTYAFVVIAKFNHGRAHYVGHVKIH